jgi:hypothetical protein
VLWTNSLKLSSPTNCGLEIASHLKNARTNEATIGNAVNTRTAIVANDTINQPNVLSRRATRDRSHTRSSRRNSC